MFGVKKLNNEDAGGTKITIQQTGQLVVLSTAAESIFNLWEANLVLWKACRHPESRVSERLQ